jgi:hypothetical protein
MPGGNGTLSSTLKRKKKKAVAPRAAGMMKVHLLGSSLRRTTINRKVVIANPRRSRIKVYRQRAPSALRILWRASPLGIRSSAELVSSFWLKKREVKRIKERAMRMRPVTKGKNPGPGIPDRRSP